MVPKQVTLDVKNAGAPQRQVTAAWSPGDLTVPSVEWTIHDGGNVKYSVFVWMSEHISLVASDGLYQILSEERGEFIVTYVEHATFPRPAVHLPTGLFGSCLRETWNEHEKVASKNIVTRHGEEDERWANGAL